MAPRRPTHEYADRRMYAGTAAATRGHEYDIAVRTNSARGRGPSTARHPLDGFGSPFRAIGPQWRRSRLRRVGPARPGQPGAHHANHEPASFGTRPPGTNPVPPANPEGAGSDSSGPHSATGGDLGLAYAAPAMERNARHCNIAGCPRPLFYP